MANEETDLKAAIIAALNASAVCLVWSTPSGKVKVRGGWVRMAPKGTPDILGYMFRTGALIALEVKTPKGTTDKDRKALQAQWRERAAKHGCVVGEVRSVDEAVRIVMAARRDMAA